MQLTSNYQLKKPEGTDVVNIEDFNNNADVIDQTLKKHDTELSDIVQDRIYYCGTTSGTNTYTAANSKITAYIEGLTVRVKIGTASTGASTLNINGLGAKVILDSLGNPITSGGLKAGLPYQLCYNGTNFIVLGKGGGGNLTSDKLLNGYTATGDSGQIVGTMPNNGATNKNLSINETYIIPKGYHDGTGKITQGIPFWNPSYGEHWEATNITVGAYSYGNGANYAYMQIPNHQYNNGIDWVMHHEPQLKPENIIQGATIFGVGGNAQQVHISSGKSRNAYSQNSNSYVNLGFKPKVLYVIVGSADPSINWDPAWNSKGVLYFEGIGWITENTVKQDGLGVFFLTDNGFGYRSIYTGAKYVAVG